MALIKKWLFILLLTVVFLVALLVAADNSVEVPLKFLAFETPVWPVAWWIMLAFVLGILVGGLLNVFSNTRLRLNARAAHRVANKATDKKPATSASKTGSVPTTPTGSS